MFGGTKRGGLVPNLMPFVVVAGIAATLVVAPGGTTAAQSAPPTSTATLNTPTLIRSESPTSRASSTATPVGGLAAQRTPGIAGASPASSVALRDRPNFLIIVSDDQRADTVDFMPRTRALIFEQGAWFTRGYVTTPLCCPSRSSVLTGMYGHKSGVLTNQEVLTETTFVDRLHETGYHTGLVGKYLNSWSGHPRPEFDFWVAMPGGGSPYFNPRLFVNSDVSQQIPGYITHLLRDYALDFLQDAPQDKPFSLIFAPNAPHAAADPAPGDEGLYLDLPPWRPPSFDVRDRSDKPAWLANRPPRTPAQIANRDAFRLKQLQTLNSLDEAVETVLLTLAEQGRLANTFVLYMSDNGFFWHEHGLTGKNRVYEEAIRVPFAVRFDRLAQQARVDTRMVANIDIAPTIYELAGIPLPKEVDGRSLLPLLRSPAQQPGGRGVPWREDLLIEGRPAQPYAAVRTGQFVYVETENARPELYDMAIDPFQLENQAENPSYAAVVARLRERLDQLLASNGSPSVQTSGPGRRDRGPAPITVDDD